MRLTTIAVLAAAALVATSAVGFCETPRSVAMGFTGYGLSDDAGAWYWNPAGLAHMNVNPMCKDEGKGDGDGPALMWQGIAGTDFGGDIDIDVLHLGGVYGSNGFAIGRLHSTDADYTEIGIGYGTTLGSPLWSVGGAIINTEGSLGDHETILDLGAMYQWHPALGKGRPAKIGLTCDDVTKEWGDPICSAGVSFWLGDRVLIAADVWDLGNETKIPGIDDTGSEFNVGAEIVLAPWLCLRAGSQDGDFTFGAGINWRGWKVDAGFVTWDIGGLEMPDVDGQLFSISRDW
jgi:hypothetical protein